MTIQPAPECTMSVFDTIGGPRLCLDTPFGNVQFPIPLVCSQDVLSAVSRNLFHNGSEADRDYLRSLVVQWVEVFGSYPGYGITVK